MVRNCQKKLELVNMVKNGDKMVKSEKNKNKNGQKRSKVVKNFQYGQKWSKPVKTIKNSKKK